MRQLLAALRCVGNDLPGGRGATDELAAAFVGPAFEPAPPIGAETSLAVVANDGVVVGIAVFNFARASSMRAAAMSGRRACWARTLCTAR